MADIDASAGRAVAVLSIFDPTLDWEALIDRIVMIACEASKGEHTTPKSFLILPPVTPS